MLGYMTEKEAKANGFTHRGSYYGLPVYMTDAECPMVALKWAPFELLMHAAMYIEGFLTYAFFPEREPSFMFTIKGEL